MANERKDRRGRWEGFNLGGGGSGGGGGQTPARSPWRFSLVYILIALAILLLVANPFGRQQREVSLNLFYSQIRQGTIKEVDLSPTSIGWITSDNTRFSTALPPQFQTNELVNQLRDEGIPVFTKGQSIWPTLLSWFFTVGLIVLVYLFLIRRMAGGGAVNALNLGKNRVKIYDRKEMKTTFGDVAGVEEAVEELREVVDFLKNPKKYQRLGGRIPKGVLLLGPPGCGKTLLARAVAGEAAVPFFFMSGSEFVEMFVGLGAARVRELFSQAKEKAPCLVFLDELDTIGKSRAGALGGSLGSHDEREQTLNQLLVEMDGFDASNGVIIMAATNRSDVLDPALTRPGRFDRQVVVDPPDLNGRDMILKVHTRGVALDPTVNLRTLAARTPGFTGADLANVVNEAALLAARREKNSVEMDELEEAIDRTVAGLERKSRVLSDREKRRVAVHEMGHALAALRCKNIDPVHRVSIVPRGAAALGMTMVRPLEDRHIMTKDELEDRMTFALGGRSAEELVFGDLSTGASDDLHRATDIARAMIVDYGMSEKLGPTAFGQNGYRTPDGRPYFPGDGPQLAAGTAQTIDEEIRALVDQARDRSMATLKDDRGLLDRLSEVLIAREVIDGDALRRWVDGEEPIPTIEELEREIEERRTANGHEDAPPARPEVISSPSPAETSEPANGEEHTTPGGRQRVQLAGETPPRPD
jgi:cell division protease FtsH